MTRRGLIVTLSVSSLAVAGAGLYRFMRHGLGEKPGDFPDGHHFVCADAACKGSLSLTTAELAAHALAHPDEDPACGVCAKPLTRAVRCDSCGVLTPRPAREGAAACSRCGKPVVDREKR